MGLPAGCGWPASGVLVRHALRRADAIVAVSSFTAERVRALVGRDAGGGPLGPRPRPGAGRADQTVARVRAHYGLPGRFVLHVGTSSPARTSAPWPRRAGGSACPWC